MNSFAAGAFAGALVLQPSPCSSGAEADRLLETLARCLMKRRSKIVLGASVTMLAVLAFLGWCVYRANFVGQTQFDTALYHAASTTTQAAPFSYDDYAATLNAYVDDKGMVNYRKMTEDHKNLNDFLIAMAHLDLKAYQSWDEKAQIAFWINAYNALTLKVIIDHYPIKAGLLSGLVYPANSIRRIPGVWDKFQFLVMGKKMTLNEIEHGVLRGENKDLVERYGRFYEPRIHVALVCAAMSCPALRNEPFVGDKLDEQLIGQTRRFVSNSTRFRITRDPGKVYLSSIFKWFGEDLVTGYKPDVGFAVGGSDAETATLHFVSGYLPAADAEFLKAGEYSIKYLKYDWTLNELKTAAAEPR